KAGSQPGRRNQLGTGVIEHQPSRRYEQQYHPASKRGIWCESWILTSVSHNKKIQEMKKYIVLLLVTTLATSCQDFLEEKQVSSLTQDFYNTEGGLDTFIKGLYVYARVKHEWDANGAKLMEPETDAYMHSNGTLARYQAGAYGNDVSTIAGTMN